MSPEGYDAFEDPYCYPGASVLRNRLEIHNQAELDAFEVEISTLRAEEPLPEGGFDPARNDAHAKNTGRTGRISYEYHTRRFSWQRATVVLLIYLRIANSGSWKCG